MSRRVWVRSVAAIIGVVVLLAVLGFSAASPIFGGSSRSGGATVSIVWTTPTSAAPSASYVQCRLQLTSSSLTLSAADLAPGASCAYNAVIRNTGNQLLHLSETSQLTQSRSCELFEYSDDIDGGRAAPEIGPGGSYAYHATFALAPSAGNACQDRSAVLTVVIVGSQSGVCGAPRPVVRGR